MPNATVQYPSGVSAFVPPFWLRPAMVQTAVAGQKFRKRGTSDMEKAARTEIIDCGDDVRLAGAISAHPDPQALVIFLHGWEGSLDSTYVVCAARRLYEAGCSVFRLNFRDHGDTHHLNEETFNASRFEEVFNAVRYAAETHNAGRPVYVVGFSLGGNFGLRIARRMHTDPIPEISRIFAVSPVIDPWNASPVIDKNPLIRRYFYKKWIGSMEKKQAAFPHLYDFSDVPQGKTVMGLSEKFIPQHTPFETPEAYFNSYRIEKDDLAEVDTPLTIIMAADDPVVPAEDLELITLSPSVTKIVTAYGGHNGFFQSLNGPTWYDDYIRTVIFAENR